MRYEEPKMYISMFDDEDDILTTSGNTFDSASKAAEDDIGNDAAASYSIDVKTFN